MKTQKPKQEILDDVLVELRRIVRSIDLHSKKLIQTHRLTIPQVVLLRQIQSRGRLSLSDLARHTSLSNATVTGIVDRLEARSLVRRVRSETDRRQVFVEILPGGASLMKTMPPLLQESFTRKLQDLEKWEQAQILSSLGRIANLMNADTMDASPILAHHALTASEEDIAGGGNPSKTTGESKSEAPASPGRSAQSKYDPEIRLHCVLSPDGFPPGLDMEKLVDFLHESLKPYEDNPKDIAQGIRDAFSGAGREGGFLLIAEHRGRIVGALVMQKTGMKGYVPENLLLFVAVAPDQRGKGLGRKLVEEAVHSADGNVKLHVEYDNPARRLYERVGFTSKYAEMRYVK